jgi:glycosyltransferase involved in cell wall biosynthesis
MKIRLIGKSNDSGIGTHFGQFAKALQSIGGINTLIETVDHTDHNAVNEAGRDSRADDINISFVCANMNGFFNGHNINWSVFESTRIPDLIFQTMRLHDLWIPSEWGRKVAIEQGIDATKITVVHEGVNTDLHHPYLISSNNYNAAVDRFRFLLIGKYEDRKSINESIDAFAMVYGKNPGVELVIKSDFFKDHELKRQQLLEKINSSGAINISLVWGLQSETELANLYRMSHVFLFPTKAEGWGLPLIEAAATGLPLVTTFHSAQTEFLQDIRSSVVLLNYTLEPIRCSEYQGFYPADDGNYGKWAVTSVDEIARGITRAYNNYTSLRAQAIKNSAVIRSKYSWANSAMSALNALKRSGKL